jgi:hypothetical protein
MIPGTTPFKEFYADHPQIQVLDTPDIRARISKLAGLFVVAHRREVVMPRSLPSTKVVYRGYSASMS